MDITPPALTQHITAPPSAPPVAPPTPPSEVFSVEAEQPSTGPEAIAAIKSRYDMTNITPPRQIDQLVSQLQDAGHEFGPELLILMSYGADFQSHLAQSYGGGRQIRTGH